MSVQNPPDGYTSVTPYLYVRDLAGALAFYQKALGAKVRNTFPNPDGKPMHAEISIGDGIIMFCEENAEKGIQSPLTLKGTSSCVFLYVTDTDVSYDAAIAAGCTVGMAPSDMFWGDRFGQVTDPYGHCWTFATHKEDVTPEQMKERMLAMPAMA